MLYNRSCQVKAGSHIAPAGFNATGGILIDLSLFEFVVYHPETELVDVGPGSLWQGVYDYLKPLGRSVNGATSCQGVGVAGFNLGGGFGNKANQFGLAMDTVQAIEVVLPTGKIKTVNAKQDSDIFWALKVAKFVV
jgi:FAD/FMN-containing dehydrogenase